MEINNLITNNKTFNNKININYYSIPLSTHYKESFKIMKNIWKNNNISKYFNSKFITSSHVVSNIYFGIPKYYHRRIACSQIYLSIFNNYVLDYINCLVENISNNYYFCDM